MSTEITLIFNVLLAKILWDCKWWAAVLISAAFTFPSVLIINIPLSIISSFVCGCSIACFVVPKIQKFIEGDSDEHDTKDDSEPKGPAFQN